MPNELDSTSIHTRYTEQLTADLEANRAEQASATARLEQLRTEEKWLTATLDSMPSSAPVGSVVGGSDEAVQEAAVPQPRETPEVAPAQRAAVKKAPTTKKTTAKKTSPAKKTATKKAKAPAKKTVPGKTAPKKAVGSTSEAQPTLGALIDSLLEEKFLGEPLKVSEIHAELTAAHAERSTSVQVVRNALEGLVKKGGVEKDTRQGVALYTKPRTADVAGAGAGTSVPAGEQADEAVAGA
ncbi:MULTISPECIES: hypothetical protein [unclassified Streptomyces]|uniref:hypothetical protein n=1 Tax=unclassified Streptomyces TaxID=2593676 RepID=UPI0033B2B378